MIAGAEGNLSARTGEGGGRVLVTPAGRGKDELEPADLVEVDLEGQRRGTGAGRPSTELALHLALYRARPEVGAVVHAHPPAATGFAAAGLALDEASLPELAVLGPVPLVPYATPGTPALGEAVTPYAARHDALLLSNHGAVTVGRTMEEAEARMESLEQGARILLVARLLGGARRLPPGELERLGALWEGRAR